MICSARVIRKKVEGYILEFRFKTKPYKHQLDALKTSCEKDEYALLMDMGTGNSKVLIDTIAYLYDAGEINSAFILAPKGVYKNWVGQEIPTHLPDHIEYKIAYWSSPLTEKIKKEIEAIWIGSFDLQIFVMNIEALSTKKGLDIAKRFIFNHKNGLHNEGTLLAIDESTVIKNHRALRTKNAIQLGKMAKYKRILTGSPITKSPLDLYSQFAFLSEELLGFRSYYSFCSRFADMIRRSAGSHQYNHIIGFRNLDELTTSIKPHSYRVTKEQCLDLPQKTYIKRTIELTPEQKKIYQDMKKNAVSLLDDMEQVTANAVITQILRLHQISCGFVGTDSGSIVELKSNRLTELLEILEEVNGKAIIWANYRHNIKALESILKEKYGEEAVESYYGDTPGEKRQEIVERFQKDKTLRFFIGQPRTGGYGLTLTAANTVIYYSNSYDLEVRLQSEDRVHRISQTSKVTYIDLVAEKTVDEVIVKALRQKINLATQVLGEDWKKWLI